jgi:hypothetical protein
VTVRLVYETTIDRVFELKTKKHVSGFGPDAIFDTSSAGWYIRIGNEITLFCGEEKPLLAEGQKIRITIEGLV